MTWIGNLGKCQRTAFRISTSQGSCLGGVLDGAHRSRCGYGYAIGCKVIAGGACVAVTGQVFNGASGELNFVACAVCQVSGWIDGQGVAGNTQVGACGCVVVGDCCTCCGFQDDVAGAFGNGFVEGHDNVAANRYAGSFVQGAEAGHRGRLGFQNRCHTKIYIETAIHVISCQRKVNSPVAIGCRLVYSGGAIAGH